jgi:hypothetical protein
MSELSLTMSDCDQSIEVLKGIVSLMKFEDENVILAVRTVGDNSPEPSKRTDSLIL